ncbi:hypothetical protein BCU23_21645 [Vibrio splendidus]|nr:hypothetical protein BCU63_14520 [Vibrio splendidus]PMJ58678.1 hypothetical protein BCU23_21645 [Vibrio splendidus]
MALKSARINVRKVTVNLGLYFQLNNLTYAGKRSHEKQLIERPPSAVFSPFEVLIQGSWCLRAIFTQPENPKKIKTLQAWAFHPETPSW